MKGIDISSYQSQLTNIKKDEIDFAILKISEGQTLQDKSFNNHYDTFTAAGVPLGAYVFAHAQTEENARAEAQFALKILNSRQLQLPIYYDVEAAECFTNRTSTTNCIRAFGKVITEAGYRPGLYSSYYNLRDLIDTTALQSEGFSIWAAQYNGSQSQILNCDIRQYTDTGHISTFNGYLDMNILFNPNIIKTTSNIAPSAVLNPVEQLLNTARKWLGTHENGDNITPLTTGDWDNRLYGWELTGSPWCDVFVDYCFIDTFGYEKGTAMTCQYTGCSGAACAYSAQYYRNEGRYYTYPEVGDQIFFFVNGGINHTGIVEKIEGGMITTIEGNTSDMVARRSYPIGSATIAGYGRPKWNLVSSQTIPTIPTHTAITPDHSGLEVGDKVKIINGATYYNGVSIPSFILNDTWIIFQIRGDRAVINKNVSGTRSIMSPINTKFLQKIEKQKTEPVQEIIDSSETYYTVKSGDTLWAIAQYFLGSGIRYTEIKKLNNLKSDIIRPGQILQIP